MPEIVITPLIDSCTIARMFSVKLELAERVVRAADFFRSVTGHDVEMISGFRTCAHQQMLQRRAGSQATTCDRSTHTTCPATGADFRLPGLSDTDFLKLQFGNAAVLAGLRWGGGSPERDVTVGNTVIGRIPSDWNHLDLGRRTA